MNTKKKTLFKITFKCLFFGNIFKNRIEDKYFYNKGSSFQSNYLSTFFAAIGRPAINLLIILVLLYN